MIAKRIPVLLAATLIGSIAALATFSAVGDEPGKKGKGGEEAKKKMLNGLVKKIDVEQGSLIVQPTGDGGPPEVAVNLLSQNMKVTTQSGKDLKLADIKLGMRVYLKMKGNDDVEAIEVANPVLFTFLRQINEEEKTIAVPAENKRTKVVPLASDLAVMIEGKPAKLSDLRQGEKAHITLSYDSAMVVSISVPRRVVGERPAGEGGVRKPAEGDRKPGEGDRKPGAGDRKPGEGDRKPGEGDRKPGEGDRRPGAGDRKPGEGDRKPGEGDRRPGAGDRKPGEGDRKPGAGDIRRPGVEGAQRVGDQKLIIDSKFMTDDKKAPSPEKK